LIESLERHAAKTDRGESVVSSAVDHVREQGHGGELNVCDRWKNPGKHGKRVTRLGEKAQMEGGARNAATTGPPPRIKTTTT